MSDSSSKFFPAALADNTVESLYALHGRPRPWIYWVSIGMVVAAMGALPFVPVDVTVRSSGMVRPATERTELRAPVGGRVAAVCVQDNDRVEAGQRLVQMVARDVEERLARNLALQQEKSASVADLAALTAGLERPRAAAITDADDAVAAVSLKTPLLTQAQRHFLAQLSASRLVVAQTRAGRDRAEVLAAKGIVTAQERDDARFAHARASADLALLIEQTLAAWQTQRREEQTLLAQWVSEERRLQEERTLATVRAPATGTVQGLVGVTVGSYVTAGQSLGWVSPDDRLVVETWVLPRDIALLRIGQRARLQVDAYPYTQWGLLDAVVESVGADVSSSAASAVFRVIVRPQGAALHRSDGTEGTLRKGMTLTARFVVARRSLLQILYEDAARWLNPQDRPAPS